MACTQYNIFKKTHTHKQEGTLTLGLDLPIAYPPAPAWPHGPLVTKATASLCT